MEVCVLVLQCEDKLNYIRFFIVVCVPAYCYGSRLDVRDLVVRPGIRLFMAIVAVMPYIRDSIQSVVVCEVTLSKVPPIVCTRINASTALLLGNILPKIYIHCGKA